MKITHLLRVYLTTVKLCFIQEAQYRFNFLVGLLLDFTHASLSLIFLQALFSKITAIAGWSFYEMVALFGVYQLAEAISSILFYEGLKDFAFSIRRGRLDLVLVKPVNTQFFVSTQKAHLRDFPTVVVGLALIIYGLSNLGTSFSFLRLPLFLYLFFLGFLSYYALRIFIITFNFWLPKVHNLRHLVHGVAGGTRFPIEAYGRKTGAFLTFVLPLAVIVSFPTKALLGKASFWHLPFALMVALFSLYLSNRFFRFALRYYTSAGG